MTIPPTLEMGDLTIALCICSHPAYLVDADDEHAKQIGNENFIQVKALIQSELGNFGGKLMSEMGLQLQYSFQNIYTALNFAVSVQRKIDQLNEHEFSDSIYLVSIGIDGTQTINSPKDVLNKTLELASYLAESASPGEIHITEEVYQQLGADTKIFCRFTKQLTHNTTHSILNVYEAFWNPLEIEINGGRIDDVGALDLDTQPARSFGIGLIIFILIVITITFLMTMGFRSIFQFAIQLFSK